MCDQKIQYVVVWEFNFPMMIRTDATSNQSQNRRASAEKEANQPLAIITEKMVPSGAQTTTGLASLVAEGATRRKTENRSRRRIINSRMRLELSCTRVVSRHLACLVLILFATVEVEAFAPFPVGTIHPKVTSTNRFPADGESSSNLRMIPTMTDLSTFVAENQLTADVISSGLLAGVGDTIAQKQQQRELGTTPTRLFDGLDTERLQRFMLKGCGSGVLWSNWFAISDQWCSSLTARLDLSMSTTMIHEGLVYTVASILLEQFIWCPVVYSCWDLSFPALLRGETFGEIQGVIRRKLGGLLLANAKVWTLVNLVVYSIPLEWRVILTTIVDLFWQSFVSKTTASSLDLSVPPEAIQVQRNYMQPERDAPLSLLKD